MTPSVPPPRALPRGEVHLWFAFPDEPQLHDPSLLEAYRRLMSPDERQRQQRFVFPRHRHQALVARALVRTTLARYAPEVAPAQWRFVQGEHGRPELADRASGMRFNLSHTDGLMVCGVTVEHDIGVDVEDTRRRTAALGIAERFFAPREVQQLTDSPPQRFFELWTLKESYIKARGAGLSLPLGQFAFDLAPPGEPCRSGEREPGRIRVAFDAALRDDPGAWSFALLRPTPWHAAAVAVRCRGPLRLRAGKVVPLRSEQGLTCETVARSAQA